MKKLNDGLQKVDVKVGELKTNFETLTRESATLKLKLEKTQETIQNAETLIGKLIEEFQRWTYQVKELQSELETLHQKSLLGAAFLIYSSAVPEKSRLEMNADWKKRLLLSDFDVTKFLCSENEQLSWKVEGLATDELSLENAVVTSQSLLTPIIIDPSSRSTSWLVNHYKDSNVEVINSQDINLFTKVELAVKFGKVLIIQDMNFIHPSFVPLFRKDVLHQGSRKIIQLGEKLIDYNESFNLFLTTQNPNPNLPSNMFSLFTIINFTTTMSGLTNQLLALTILNERPELEAQKIKLLIEEDDLTKQLSILENSLLQELVSAKGNILENKNLLESLEQMKQKSDTISQSLKSSNGLQAKLNSERNCYLPLADVGSRMFFIIKDLHLMNHMYHFSLNSFFNLYNKLFKSQETTNTNENIKHMIHMLLNYVYIYYSRSLYKKDSLVFALLLIYNTQADTISNEEWDIFIGLINHHSLEIHDNSVPDWMDKNQAPFIDLIKKYLPELHINLDLNDKSLWHTFNSAEGEAKLPHKVSNKISKFQELLVIQMLKPESLQTYMMSFVGNVFGFKEMTIPNLSIKQLYEQDSNFDEPILFIFSQGADPCQELENFAKKIVGLERYNQVALGQGQTEKAIEVLRSSATNGDWLCLKNLHLCLSWLPVLEKEIKSLKPHENFRLWLTTENHTEFPIVFLQSCLKVMYEAPAGIKKNLLRTYEAWGRDFISNSKNQSRAQAYFRLAWFHAVIQERRSYIPQGWSKFYEFGQTDLKCGTDVLEKLFKCGSGSLSWSFIQGLFEETIYGGRIDNIFDNQVLVSYLQLLLSSNSITKVGPLKLPQSSSYEDYIDAIESLPEFDKPSFFGLPENIELLSHKSACNEITKQLRTFKQITIKNDKFDRTLWSEQLMPFISLWRELNSEHKFMKSNINETLDFNCQDPVKIFLSLELQNALKLVHFIHQSMLNLNKMLIGQHSLSTEMYNIAVSLINFQTPDSWLCKWDGPINPNEYLRNLITKTIAISKWKKKAEGASLVGCVFDLSNFLHPDSFLNAFKQLFSRNLKLSIDEIELDCSWKNEHKSTEMFIKVEGLKLECCNFDGSILSEKNCNESIICDLPPCNIFWVPKQKLADKIESVLPVPVYFNHHREGVISKLYLPYSGGMNKWILLGPAILLG